MTRPDAEAIAQAIGASRRAFIEHIDVFASIDSTNDWLMQTPSPGQGRFRIAVSGEQTSGRGRRGRQWRSPPGAGLYMSLSWSTAVSLDALAGVTLVAGTCVASALEDLGVTGASLKWPNDIMLNDGKLGGILTETRVSGSGQVTVVTGIGINIDLARDISASAAPPARPASPAIQASDLASVLDRIPESERLAGNIADAVIAGYCDVADGKTDAYFDRWMARDWLAGRAIIVDGDEDCLRGDYRGIDAGGALLLAVDDEVHRVVVGSVRPDLAGEGIG